MWIVPAFFILHITPFVYVVSLINAQGFRYLHAFDNDDDASDDGRISSVPPSSTRNRTSSITSQVSFIRHQSAWNRTTSSLESGSSASPSLKSQTDPSRPASDFLGGYLYPLPSAYVSWAKDPQCTSSWVTKLGAANKTLNSAAQLTYSIKVPEAAEDSPLFKVFAGGQEVSSVWNGDVCCGDCWVQYHTVSVYYWPVKNEHNTWCLKYLSGPMTGAPNKTGSTVVNDRTRTESAAKEAATLPKFSALNSQKSTLSAPTRTQLQVIDPTSVVERLRTTPNITPAPVLLREQPGTSTYHTYLPRSFIPLHDNDTIPALGINGTKSGDSSVPYAIAEDGFVFISPSVYVVFSTVMAQDRCGQVGPKLTSLTFAYAENELSSIDMIHADTRPYNFADLPCPPKTWAFDAQVPNPFLGHERALGEAVRDYHPSILGPAKRLRQLDPLWSSCIVWDVGNGYDPPRTLEPHTVMIDPHSIVAADPQDPVLDPQNGQRQPNTVDLPASPSSQVQVAGLAKDDPLKSDAMLIDAHPLPSDLPSPVNNPAVASSLSYLAEPAENEHHGPKTILQQASSISPPESSSPPAPQPAFAPQTPNAPITQPLDAHVVIHGPTVKPDAPTVGIDGSYVAVSGGSIHVDGSSAKAPQVPAIYTDALTRASLILANVGGQVISADATHAVVNGQTLTAGAQPIDIAGTQVRFESSALQLGNDIISLPPPESSQDLVALATVAGQPIIGNLNIAVVGGQRISRGGPPVTIAGTRVSLGDSTIQVGSETIQLIRQPRKSEQPNGGPSSPGKKTADGEPSHTVDQTATSIGLTNSLVGSNTMSLDALSGSGPTVGGKDRTTKSSGTTPASTTSIAETSFGTARDPPSVPTMSKKGCGGPGLQPARSVKTIVLTIVIVGLIVVR